MFKKIKNFLKNSLKSNERGSVMSVTLIVITILAFSITTITSVTVNLAGSTTHKLEQVNDENTAKGLIRQAISEFEEVITVDEAYDNFILNHIPRILTDYNVIVTDETENIPEYGVFGEIESRAFRFAYLLNNGNYLVKYSYVSNFGSSVENFNPFDYSIGTSGTLLMNGGYYDEINIFGQEIFMGARAPYIRNGTTTESYTPYSSRVFPVLTTSGPSEVFASTSYEFCDTTCYTLNPFTLVEDNYDPVEGSSLPDQGIISSTIINDFFGSFDYDDYAIEYVQLFAPTDSREITDSMTLDTVGDVVFDNSEKITYEANGKTVLVMPTTPFINIDEDDNFDFSKKVDLNNFSAYFPGDLTLSRGLSIEEEHSLVIHGDLYIENTKNNKTKINGTIIVTGNVYFIGNDVDLEGAFFVFGETFVNFEEGEGITTPGQNMGFSIIAKDNIWFEEIYESHDTSAAPTDFQAFIYTEESIFIDAVNSRLHMAGSLFARGIGNPTTQMYILDEDLVPINGIIINSYRGHINSSGVAVSSTDDSANRFNMSKIPRENYQDRFINIPTFDSIVTSYGNFTFETTEFLLE